MTQRLSEIRTDRQTDCTARCVCSYRELAVSVVTRVVTCAHLPVRAEKKQENNHYLLKVHCRVTIQSIDKLKPFRLPF